jgi:hypothetical protein
MHCPVFAGTVLTGTIAITIFVVISITDIVLCKRPSYTSFSIDATLATQLRDTSSLECVLFSNHSFLLPIYSAIYNDQVLYLYISSSHRLHYITMIKTTSVSVI